MWENIKWLRLVPDQPGRGGTKTGFHSFQQQPINDVRFLQNAHVYQGAWRSDYASILYPTPQSTQLNSSGPLVVHGYVYPSLTDPSAPPSVRVLSQHAIPGSSQIWDFTSPGGGVRASRPGTNQPAMFQNIDGRCFIGDGGAEGLILDNRTPAIHAQLNQNLGIGTPTQNLPTSFPSGITPYGTGYLYNGGHYVCHPDPSNMLSTITTADTVSFSFPNVSYGQYGGVVIVQASPSTDGETSNTIPFANTGTISITTGTSLVTLAGATWPANFAYCGMAINFNGFSFVIAEHGVQATAYDINGTATALTNVQLLILGVYDGPTATNIPYTITGCRVLMPGAASSAKMVNTGTLGYSQTTQSNLVQVQVLVLRASGYFRNLGNISLGPSSEDSASGGAIQTITDATMFTGKKILTSASTPFDALDKGQPMFVDGAGTVSVLSTFIEEFFSTTTIRLAAANSSGAPLLGVNAWWGANPTISDGAMAIASTTLTSASNPFVPGDVGQTIVVEDAVVAGPPGTALITTIATYVNAGTVTLTAGNATGGNITNRRVWWRGISVLVHSGPTYAYAWYDPETGHMSNISPLYQIPRPTVIGSFTDFANITPVFQIDPGYISYPTGIDATRFSHLVFFRTLSAVGSSTLYPIGSLQPFIGKVHPGSVSTRGSWSPSTYRGWMGLPSNYADAPPSVPANQNLWYDFSSDSDLILSGGFRAPQFTNEKPMVLLRGGVTQPGHPYLLAHWDRRTWIVNTQEPNVIAFSCDEQQCPLGVPTEAFPATNRLTLPSSSDASAVGMRTIGDMLLITTQRFAYTVAGNNESNYRLLKISSSMPGVGTYQMDEFPTITGAEGEPTTLFYLGRDRKVYQWTVGGRVIPISQPIQDQLDSLLKIFPTLQMYRGSRIHCVSAWGRRLVIVAPYLANGVQDGVPTFVYDIDNQIWSNSQRGDQTIGLNAFGGTLPMTTIYGLDPPVNELYTYFVNAPFAGVYCRSWIRDDQAVANSIVSIITFPTTFDGKKSRKQLVSLNIHALAGTYTGSASVDEGPGSVFTFAPYPDPLYSIYAAGASPVDGNATDQVVLAAQFNATGVGLIGYRFSVTIQRTDLVPTKIFAVDIGYIDAEEAEEGDP